jgi:phospholipid/cholesterol/gamma-HCH transport system substrate-binding protein
VSALQSSHDLLQSLNQNLASTTALLSNSPDEVGNAVSDVNSVVDDVQKFVADNRETVGITSDKLASITTALNQSIPDIKQTLHIAAPAFQNFVNIYQPAQATLTGALAFNNFANPIQFLCSAVQAASHLGAEQSAKLCVQYLAPIIKNRQFNFPPIGGNPIVGATARPNEITYSEDWMRPDYIPPAAPVASAPQDGLPPAGGKALVADPPPLPAEAQPASPAGGLQSLMVPPGAGS